MASYVLKQARVTLTSITSTTYNTVTDALTVPSGHLYIIKGLKQTIGIASTSGAIAAIGSAWFLTDASGTNAAVSSPLVYLTSAGAVASTSVFVSEWAAENANPAATLGLAASQIVTAAIVAGGITGYKSGTLHNIHMQAGQVLEYRPYGSSLADSQWSVSGTLSASIYIDISYIDYTL